jgi:hypothetical protein
MGYDTRFRGTVKVDPPLNSEEIRYLQKFCDTRRMFRKEGPYYVDGPGVMGQDPTPNVINYNSPPAGQPNTWCKWQPSVDGKEIHWSGMEKFYDADLWMKYLIDHFLKPGCAAKDALPFLQANHVVEGMIEAQGEDGDDRWDLVVRDNRVFVRRYRREPDDERSVE